MKQDVITRCVVVDRSRTQQSVFNVPGRRAYLDSNIVNAMPLGEGREIEVVFFRLGYAVSDIELEDEYKCRSLIPADPYSLAAVNESDPAFAKDHPNLTHWRDASGKWSCGAFSELSGIRYVGVYYVVNRWDDYWWFAGLPQDLSPISRAL